MAGQQLDFVKKKNFEHRKIPVGREDKERMDIKVFVKFYES